MLRKNYRTVFLIFLILIFSSCSAVNYQRIRGIRKAAIDITKYRVIYFSNFRIVSDMDNESLNKTMVKILKDELSIYHKKNLHKGESLNLSVKGIFSNRFFWREYAPEGDVIITGAINLDKKEREQIVSERETALSLKKIKRLKTVKIVITTIDFYIINAKTGEIIYKYKFNNKIVNEQNDSDTVIINRVFSIAADRFLNRIVPREYFNYRYLFNY